MTQSPPNPDEAAINAMIRAVPLLENHAVADLDDATRMRLMQDVAYAIYPSEDIAVRYGFGTVARLKHWLVRNPGVFAEISRLRAIHNSDAATKERAGLKSQHIIEQALPSMSAMITNPSMPADIRLKAFDACMHVGGFKGTANAQKEITTGTQFNLVMNFPGGKEFRISPTVVVDEVVPALGDSSVDDDALDADA